MMFYGSMVALITPITKAGALDEEALVRLVDWQCEAGTDALVLLGSTGEAATLTPAERRKVIELSIQRVDGLMPVIVGTGTNATQTTLEYTREAQSLGADAALVSTPYYNRPTQAGLIAHFSAVADLGLPVILYNVPGRTAVDMLPDTVFTLAKHPNIVGIKEAHSLQRCLELLNRNHEDDFVILSGDDVNALPSIKAGAAGVVSVAANIVPETLHRCIEAALNDDFTEAETLMRSIQALIDILFVETNPIPTKYCLSRMGKIENVLRLPLLPLSAEYHAQVDAALQTLHLIPDATRKGVHHG